ncbi:hypothetical protein QWY99_04795 [Flavobacterium branchiarum]|uniref:Uncharacterized protein n=1 Tax=Flavobacterium branchiarum TaxID=1114870 RepID=A0ABV5FK57_9FLAO|nr:hypothetical protein [Flavobacterium branchiarum]MDN3672374.1 hypothetical protein [Flavobacterium branchiarum]
MSKITLIELFAILCEKVGKETAESLTTYIESKIDKEVEYNTMHMATKEDLAKVLSDIKTDMLKCFISLFIVLAIMILGLYFK